ncbi:MAG: DNRLRE domain-containing protein [Chloroflexi bacterium]|nr:DNRLRE domain-containing protein [Chloroflexota bacterium]
MRSAVPLVAFIASLIAISVVLAGVASALALARPDVERLDANLASLIRADYSADPDGTTLAPLGEGIIDVARQDEAYLREISGVEIVPVFVLDRTGDSTSGSGDSTSGSGGGTGSGDSTSGSGDGTGSGGGGTGSGDGTSGSGDSGTGSGDGGSTPGDGAPGSTPTPTPTGGGTPGSTPTPAPGSTPTPPPSDVNIAILVPVSDTYVSDADSQLGNEDYFRTRSRNGGPENVTSLIRFSAVNQLPSGASITNASLNLYMYSAKKADDPLNVHRVTLDWNEGAVNWSSHGWKSGAYNTAAEWTIATGAVGWKKWDVTSAVQAWVTGTYAEYGLYIMNDSAGGGHDNWFYSREYSDPNFRPYLEVTYTLP